MYARSILLLFLLLCNSNLGLCSASEPEENGYCEINEEAYSLLNKSRVRWQVTKLDELFSASECFPGNDSNDKRQNKRRAPANEDIPAPIKGRVLDGENANRGRYKYMVSLTNSNGQHLCGGTLIAPDVVLTAAHCSGFVKKAQIGRYDISDSREIYETINIFKTLQHPDYDSSLARNDFMLILLESPSSYPLVKLSEDDPMFPQNLWVMGWGNQSTDGRPYKGPLQEIELTYKSNERCSQSSGIIDGTFVSYFGLITDAMMCAGTTSGGTCYGDSGGPLIMKGSDDQTDIQLGIASWSFSCAKPKFPGVFARVSNQIQWIKRSTCVLSAFDPPSLGCPIRRPGSRPDPPPDCKVDSDCRAKYTCFRGKCLPPRIPPSRPDRRK